MTAASDIYSFTVTIPAGTTADDPYTADCSFPPASVVGIRWRVPPGPSGLMGWQITSDGAPVIPRQGGAWLVADDESASWDLSGYQDSGSWQVAGYNADIWDHAVYLDFLVTAPGGDQAAAGQLVPPPALAPAAVFEAPPPDVTGFEAGVQVQT